MTNRVLCGVHALKQKDENVFYPVAVYFNVKDHMTHRECGLVADDPQDSIEHCLDYIEDAIAYYATEEKYHIAGVEYTAREIADENIKLSPMRVYYPKRGLVGETLKGQVVGWHVDYKTNDSKKCDPCLITNVAWMDSRGFVNYVIVDKMNIQPKSPKDIARMMSNAFTVISKNMRLGGELTVDVVPAGPHRARYVINEYKRPLTFTEEILGALGEMCTP